jgi:hypothetical protein
MTAPRKFTALAMRMPLFLHCERIAKAIRNGGTRAPLGRAEA